MTCLPELIEMLSEIVILMEGILKIVLRYIKILHPCTLSTAQKHFKWILSLVV